MSRRSRSRTRRRNRGRFGPLFKLLCVLAVVVALTGGATVFFRVETVTVTGNQRYTQEEIIAASGIQMGDNLYALNKVRIDRKIRTQLPYVGELSINRALPSTILINVTEWEAVAQVAVPDPEQAAAAQEDLTGGQEGAEPVPLAQEPWLISVKGKLLEPAPADSGAIPVTGLTPIAPEAGSMLAMAKSRCLLNGEMVSGHKGVSREEAPALSPLALEKEFPQYAPALFDLIHQTELAIQPEPESLYTVRQQEAVQETRESVG